MYVDRDLDQFEELGDATISWPNRSPPTWSECNDRAVPVTHAFGLEDVDHFSRAYAGSTATARPLSRSPIRYTKFSICGPGIAACDVNDPQQFDGSTAVAVTPGRLSDQSANLARQSFDKPPRSKLESYTSLQSLDGQLLSQRTSVTATPTSRSGSAPDREISLVVLGGS